MSRSNLIVGVDVGGTFTDVFVLNEETGELNVAKVPSTLDNQSRGFIEGIAEGAQDFSAVKTVVHGTTTGTNALLERKGAKTGIITTRGFRDVLEMRRRDRPTTWGLWGMFEPVVPRNLRLEVDERTLADGTIHTPVDLAQVEIAARQLLQEGCNAVCIFFINGYANAENETLALDAVQSIWPNDHITAATQILPEIREFERCSTATLNAYLQPVLGNYLQRLENALADENSPADVMIVQSNGGLMGVETAKSFPVRTALSGPAAGVIAASRIAGAAGFDNIITCDMGGTSFDVSLVADGSHSLAAQTQIDFGMVIRTPMIEISTIGAGGGSIARVDEGGLLEVGPESAGANPGPVAYGLGNDRPTVTDANLVLGRINPDRPIGGKLDRLDVEAAKAAIDSEVGAPLGLATMEAAEAIIRVANAKMAGAIRLISIERGHDPKRFAAMPFGGGGSLHTGALMQEIGLGAAIVPRFPGVTSAIGCVVADVRLDRVQTVNSMLADLDIGQLRGQMSAIAEELETRLQQTRTTLTAVERQFEFDMLYLGQTHTIVADAGGDVEALTEVFLQSRFEQAYKAAYGRLLEGLPVRVVNVRVAAIGRRPELDLSGFKPPSETTVEECIVGTRNIWHGGEQHTAHVYERLKLPKNATIEGPALLEQPDTTIFIDPGLKGVVDEYGNLIMTRQEFGDD
ncbi:MAG: hydantoinase/oxoprolinase family protein [Rhizobiaceae bacterium]